MTLLEVAKKLGVTESTVQRYESGVIENLKYDTIVKLANLYRTTPAYLMGWTESIEAYQPLKDAKWDKFREVYGMSASSGSMDDTLQPLLDAWMQLSDEAQQQLIQYAEFLLSKEDK